MNQVFVPNYYRMKSNEFSVVASLSLTCQFSVVASLNLTYLNFQWTSQSLTYLSGRKPESDISQFSVVASLSLTYLSCNVNMPRCRPVTILCTLSQKQFSCIHCLKFVLQVGKSQMLYLIIQKASIPNHKNFMAQTSLNRTDCSLKNITN